MFRKTILALVALAMTDTASVASGQSHVTFSAHGIRMTVAPARGPFGQRRVREPGLISIFDNMLPAGKYPYGTYFCCYSGAISGPNGSFFGQQWLAQAFTPSADATVTEIEVGLDYVTGTNSVNIGLYNDASGLPGTALYSADVSNLPNFGSCCTVMKLKDKSGIVVSAGTQYWVVLSTDSGDSDFFGGWNANTRDQVNPVNEATNAGSGWYSGGTQVPAFSFAVLGK